MNAVTNKPIEVIEMTRFKNSSDDLTMANVLLVLGGSAIGGLKGWDNCASPAALRRKAAGIPELLGWIVNEFCMVDGVK